MRAIFENLWDIKVQNAAARLITGIGFNDGVTPSLQQLHWLPVSHRITYKLCILMHLVNTGSSPAYLTSLVTATSDLAARQSLRSASSRWFEVPRTTLKFGERSFSFAGPTAWNSLPADLQKETDIKTFKKHLKTILFSRAFSCAWTFNVAVMRRWSLQV